MNNNLKKSPDQWIGSNLTGDCSCASEAAETNVNAQREVLARFLQSWIPANADCIDEKNYISMQEAECFISSFECGVHALLAQYLDEDQSEMAGRAYDVGIAGGFYGRESSITEGLRIRYESMLKDAIDNPVCSLKLIREIEQSGWEHGRIVKGWCERKDETDASLGSPAKGDICSTIFA